jgi:hypothetical protein
MSVHAARSATTRQDPKRSGGMRSFRFFNKYHVPGEEILDAFEFAARLHQLGEERPTTALGAVWLRGQANGNWKLQPSIGRCHPVWLGLRLHPKPAAQQFSPKEIEAAKDVEYNFLHRFRRQAHAHLGHAPTRWETITLAQHHGLPTRLLDWTSNPLAALYFAAESESHQDGAVFAFRPVRYFTQFLCVHPDEPLQKHNREPLKVKGVKIIYSMMSSSRLVAQSGAFTIQSPWTPLEEQSKHAFMEQSLDIVEMFKWRLPKQCKVEILRQLNRTGIHHGSLFPDLQGAGTGLLRSQLLRTDVLVRR